MERANPCTVGPLSRYRGRRGQYLLTRRIPRSVRIHLKSPAFDSPEATPRRILFSSHVKDVQPCEADS
jgi:hypothetical protein